jgi:hypothetical protein
VSFQNLLRDFTVHATLCWRSLLNWRRRGLHDHPILCAGSRIHRTCRLLVPGAHGRNSHQLIHHGNLRIPPKFGRLKRKRKPGIFIILHLQWCTAPSAYANHSGGKRFQTYGTLCGLISSLDYVFFPHSGVISVVAVYANGNTIEMATIGREGCSGVQALLGAKISSVRLLVQIPGSAAKMSRAAYAGALESMPSFRALMYDYVEAFLEQVMVTVACNGAHSLKERLARWLLMMRDRGDEDTLAITQDILAEMLGAQRPSVMLPGSWNARD